MPFEIGDSVNKVTEQLLKAPIIGSIAKNPIYTALVLSALTMLIILYIFRSAVTDDPLILLTFRAGFWLTLLSTCVIFIQNRVLCDENSAKTVGGQYEQVFKNNFGGSYEPGIDNLEDVVMPVKIANLLE